jgi:hypothetical protein
MVSVRSTSLDDSALAGPASIGFWRADRVNGHSTNYTEAWKNFRKSKHSFRRNDPVGAEASPSLFGSPCLSTGWLFLLNRLWMLSGFPSIQFFQQTVYPAFSSEIMVTPPASVLQSSVSEVAANGKDDTTNAIQKRVPTMTTRPRRATDHRTRCPSWRLVR